MVDVVVLAPLHGGVGPPLGSLLQDVVSGQYSLLLPFPPLGGDDVVGPSFFLFPGGSFSRHVAVLQPVC